jgi:hypothetical protein
MFLIINFALIIYDYKLGSNAFKLTGINMLDMLSILPPTFILLGLLDVWVDKALMIKLTGKGSGIKGAVIAFLLGSLAAGPLIRSFPDSRGHAEKREQILKCSDIYRCVVNHKSPDADVRGIFNGA